MKDFSVVTWIFIIALILVGPFLLIWCVSTLWDVPAVYDFWHWLAAFCFSLFVAGSSSSK